MSHSATRNLTCSVSEWRNLRLISRNLTMFLTDLPVHVTEIDLGKDLIDKFPNFGKSCKRDQLSTLKIDNIKLTKLFQK